VSFKTVLVVKAVVCLSFGLVLLFAPVFLVDLLGAELGDAGAYTAREYGAAMLGILMLVWLSKDVTEPATRYPILMLLFVYDAIGLVVTTYTILAGVLGPLAWGIVAVYLYFTLASGYLLAGGRYKEAA